MHFTMVTRNRKRKKRLAKKLKVERLITIAEFLELVEDFKRFYIARMKELVFRLTLDPRPASELRNSYAAIRLDDHETRITALDEAR